MALGTDIVKISRMDRLTENQIPDKIFSSNEILYINSKKNKSQTAAGIYAAKEAVLKALGCGITLPLNEAEILHNSHGKPYINLLNSAKGYANDKGITEIEISISHDGEYAVASAYAKEDKHTEYYFKAIEKFKDAPKNAITPVIAGVLLPKRSSETHKGSYGRLYALAGSKGLTGAAVMACNTALKCGAGLISLGCAEELNTIFEISMKEVMTKPLKSKDGLIVRENTDTILKEIQAADLCLIGPGLGRSNDINNIIKSVLSHCTTPLVIDADGLNALASDMSVLENHKMSLILTPHIGEFARLTGLPAEEILTDTEKYAKEFAIKYNAVLVLKSHRTVVALPDGRIFVNILGNPGMATGGSGDVLSGAIASFAAQGKTPSEAAVIGVYIHSLAADMAVCETGEYSLTPSDIMKYIPYSISLTQIQAKEMHNQCVPGQK